jgi:hypothetical protein
MYHKTNFFKVVSQAKGFKLNFSESALETDLEIGSNSFQN